MSLISVLPFLPNRAVSEIDSFLKPFPLYPFPNAWTYTRVQLVQTVERIYLQCKKNATQVATEDHSESYTDVYDLQNYHCTVETIRILAFKIVYYEKDNKTTRQLCTFTCETNGKKQEEDYFLRDEYYLRRAEFYPICPFLNGNEFEWINREDGIQRELVPASEWDDWRSHQCFDLFYRQILHPLFFQAVEDCCTFKSAITVLDLGGSAGELSLMIAAISQVKRVILLDQSEVAIQRAKENKKTHGHWDKIEPSPCDITELSQISSFVNDESCDIILLSGVIHKGVLTKKDSEGVLEICKMLIKPGGFILVSGYSEPFFHSVDYVEMGFTVLNKTARHADRNDVLPFYALTLAS